MHTAVAVAEQWFTLNRQWVIASCGDGVPGVLAQSVGMKIWDVFPASEEAFRDIYDAGWSRGQSSGIVYYNEAFAQIETLRRGDELMVSFDYMCVNGLREAIEKFASHLQPCQDLPEPSARPRLRVVSG